MRHTAQRIIVPPVFRGSYVVSSSRLCFPVPSSFPFHLLWSGFVRSSPHYSLPSGGDGVNEEREAETSERHPTKGRGVKARSLATSLTPSRPPRSAGLGQPPAPLPYLSRLVRNERSPNQTAREVDEETNRSTLHPSFLGSHVTRLISSSSLHIETRE